MKYKIAIGILLATAILWPVATQADVYVIVDENGVAQSGAIVCDAATCGDPNSLYSRLTLAPGQRYALQGLGSVGVGNNNPNTQVKVDSNNTWTASHTDPITEQTTITIINDSPATKEVGPQPILTVETSTATTETATVSSETATATTIDYQALQKAFELVLANFDAFIAFITTWRP